MKAFLLILLFVWVLVDASPGKLKPLNCHAVDNTEILRSIIQVKEKLLSTQKQMSAFWYTLKRVRSNGQEALTVLNSIIPCMKRLDKGALDQWKAAKSLATKLSTFSEEDYRTASKAAHVGKVE